MTIDIYNPEKNLLIQRKAGNEKQRIKEKEGQTKKKNNYLKVQLFPREDSKGGRVEL